MKKAYFKTSFIGRLSNDEFPQLVLQLIEVMDEYPCDYSLIQSAFDRLRAHTSALSRVMNNYNYHPLTSEIDVLAGKRLRSFALIRGSARANSFSTQSDVREWAMIVTDWLRPYHNKWRRPLIDRQTQYTANMQQALYESETLAEALTKLGLAREFEAMVQLNRDIEEKFMIRIADVAANRRDMQAIREGIMKDLQNMLIAIQCTDQMNSTPDENLRTLIGRLRELISSYHRRYKIRETKRRKATSKTTLSIDIPTTRDETTGAEDKTVV